MADDRAREAGLPDLQWPLRVVSQDNVNMTELGSDGGVLTDRAKLADSLVGTFVMTAGDTMTGPLIVKDDNGSPLTVRGETIRPNLLFESAVDAAAGPRISLQRSRGTLTSPLPVVENDTLGRIGFFTIGTYTGAAAGERAAIAVTALSTPTPTTVPDVRIRMSAVSADGAKTAQVACQARVTGSSVEINSDTFIVTATGSVTAGGDVSIKGFLRCSPTYPFGALMTPKSPSADSPLTGFNTQLIDDAPSQVSVCYQATHGGHGTDFNAGYMCATNLAAGPNNYAFYSSWEASNYFRGKTGIGWAVPTVSLEVGGATKLRGTCDITGDITSSGTAHSFAAGSIGSPAVIGNTPRTIAATGSAGSAGQMVWDDNFLYLRTTAGWKKVALTAI